MANKPPKAPVGRPTGYRPEYCELLLQHMKDGYSIQCFGAVVGVCFDTVYEWIKVHPDFSEAKKQGDQFRIKMYEQFGIDALQGKTQALNSAVWIFSMKNIAKWTDKQEIETTDVSKMKALESLSDKELRAKAKKLLGE